MTTVRPSHRPSPDGWMLADILRIPGTRYALLISADGLLQTHAGDITPDEAEPEAAAATGLQSLSRNITKDSSWNHTLIGYADQHKIIMGAGQGSILYVTADKTAELDVVAHRMSEVVKRMGTQLASAPRHASDPV
ncbi:roadblock/LC7 domain-containing protein [Microbispora sp. NBRC 16548]|uniref:roadblock/LC7 domain-containing protein n=1 Tax=Microbispora sp. NBRC 16548 TaxID=3030994 RepID=UPI0024A3D139|nr:roadblock/LC7 domain-containing protein [Microbispora sp. NBRC 16548]GLX06644.1 hypothetical protein Misp03_35710 [Microbispora sp. NBRC 16548]